MDLIIRQSHGLILFSSIVPWDNNPGKTVTEIQYSFNDIPSLAELNLSKNLISKIEKDCFQNSIKLKFLDLSYN